VFLVRAHSKFQLCIDRLDLAVCQVVASCVRTLRRSMASRCLNRSRSSPIGCTTQISGCLVVCLCYLRFVVVNAEVIVVESYSP
jgi:hypothetical protein